MTIEIQLADKDMTVEFPDGTPETVMRNAIMREFYGERSLVPAPPKPPAAGLAGMVRGIREQAGMLTPTDRARATVDLMGGPGEQTRVQRLTQFGDAMIAGAFGTAEGLMGGIQWITGSETAKELGNLAKTWQQDFAPEDPTFVDEIAMGAGSMATFFIPGMGIAIGTAKAAMLAPRLAVWAGIGTASSLEAMTEAGMSFRETMEETKDKKKAEDAASKTFWANMVLLPITNRLGIFGEKGKAVRRVVMSMLMEGSQEGAQEVISAVARDKNVDPEQVARSFAVGAIVAGPVGMISARAMPKEGGQPEVEPRADLEALVKKYEPKPKEETKPEEKAQPAPEQAAPAPEFVSRSGGEILESVEGARQERGYVPSQEVPATETPQMGPTAFEQLKGQLKGRPGRFKEMAEKVQELEKKEETETEGTGEPEAKEEKPVELLPLITSLQRPGQPRELVSISDLRDKANMPAEAFDKALLQLAQEGKVALHQHDFASSLTEEKRKKLLSVPNPKAHWGGRDYYVGVVPKGAPKEPTPAAEEKADEPKEGEDYLDYFIRTGKELEAEAKEPISFTPEERAKFIEEKVFSGRKPNSPDDPAGLVLTAGPPGGGKGSTKAAAKLDESKYLDADADKWKKIAGYEKQAPEFHEESSTINKQVGEEAVEKNFPVIYDSLLSNFGYAKKLIDKVLAKGGEVQILATNIGPETSIVRSKGRNIKGESQRTIPISASVKGYNRSLPTFLELFKQYKDSGKVAFYLSDNDVDGRLPVLVFSHEAGKTDIKDQDLFDKLIKTPYKSIGGGRYERTNPTKLQDLDRAQIQQRVQRVRNDAKAPPRTPESDSQTQPPKGTEPDTQVTEEKPNESVDTRRGKPGEATPEDDRGRPGDQKPDSLPAAEERQQPAGVSEGQGTGDDAGVSGGEEPGSPTRRARKQRERQPARTGEGDRLPAPDLVGVDTGNVPRLRSKGSDHVIPEGGLQRQGGWKTSAKNNLDAIELSKKILSENRPATKEEQEILVKYVGWGATELANNMFPGYARYREMRPDYGKEDWKPLVERLQALLTEEELRTAARSTQYAHFTSEKVIRSIYKTLERFGFDGGKVLEPGSGIGHFIGLLPEKIRDKVLYTGIEMDSISAGISKLLYPNHNIITGDYTKTVLPRDFFDAAIGNPPFGATAILADPEYRKHRFKLHNYFFAKSLDRVRPGGVLVFVTSHFTLDAKTKRIREYLAKSADFIGAVRLPQTAFKQNAGTEVVTDVIFLKKRVKGEQPAGAAWMELAEVKTPEGPAQVNEYFANHPEMVLGKHSLQGSMRAEKEYTVLPLDGDIEALFDKAVEKLPENVYSKITATPDSLKKKTFERDYNPKNKKEGGIYLSEKGTLQIVDSGSGVDIEAVYPKLTTKEKAWLKDYVELRDVLKQAHYDQLTDGDWEASLKKLQATYKKFVKKNGRVLEYTTTVRHEVDEDGNKELITIRKEKNWKLLYCDAEGSIVAALEKVSEDGSILEQPVLTQRTIKKPEEPKIETVADALAVSLNQRGKLDIAHIAELVHKKDEEVIEQLGDLIYKDPSGGLVLADEYLSGNVVRKLEEAEQAAKTDEAYKRNVEALRKVQPEPLSVKDITVSPGAPWIPTKYLNEFGREVLNLRNCKVTRYEASNTWTVSGAFSPQGMRVSSEYGTADRGANEIFEAALNNRAIRITRTDEDKKTYTDTAATTAANEKLKKLKDKFSSWVWTDGTRANDLLERYNHDYNNLAPRRFDGSHLTLPGASALIKLHDHQKRAIWRIIQTGNTYLAHAVGAGKTFVMISAGMEMKRLGLISKPLYVVPKHMLGQFAREFNELYPMAHVMVADEENFHTENRRRFVAQASLNNPDAIVVPHSSFGLFRLKAETIKPVRDDFISELQYARDEMEEEDEPRYLIKQMESRIEQAEQRFDSMISEGDKAITFEEMGVDFLFLDEAHEFRKLDYITNQKIKGIDPNGSKRAMDLYIKTLWLDKQNPGRSHTFASGTPITNTLGELYSVMRFFEEETMKNEGLNHFDAWSSMFARAAIGYEMNSAGRYQPVERFSRFINIPELMSRVRRFMDVLTLSQLASKVNLPQVKGNKPEVKITKAVPELKDYQDHVLQKRIEESLKWKPSPNEKGNPDPMINIITDGRLASIDMRFVNPHAPNNPDSKLNRYLDNIIETYHQTKENEYADLPGAPSSVKGSAQVCFFNTGFGEAVTAHRGFDAKAWANERLKQGKVPLKEVAWIDEYDTAQKKEALFKDIRTGKKRILFGSAKKMGTGMNIQNRLSHLHYLDAPWYPADVEQPMGRIIRQGNQNKVIDIRWYATKGSYDATMWQLVSTKSKFIEKAFLGEKDLRSMEDISEASQYEMASALASGDDRVIRLVALRAQIEKYSNLKQEHENDKHRFKSQIEHNEWSIKNWQTRVDRLRRMEKFVPDYVQFESGEIDGQTYDKREQFSDALIGKIDKREGLDSKKEVLVGKINGFSIYQIVTRRQQIEDKETGKTSERIDTEVALRFERGLDERWAPGEVTAARLIAFLNHIGSERANLEASIKEKNEKIKEYRSRLQAPFEFEREYAEAIAEAARLEEELAGEGQVADKAAKQAFTQMTDAEADQNRAMLTRNFLDDVATLVFPDDKGQRGELKKAIAERTPPIYIEQAYNLAIDAMIDQQLPVGDYEIQLDNLKRLYLKREAYLDYPAIIGEYPDFETSVLAQKAQRGENILDALSKEGGFIDIGLLVPQGVRNYIEDLRAGRLAHYLNYLRGRQDADIRVILQQKHGPQLGASLRNMEGILSQTKEGRRVYELARNFKEDTVRKYKEWQHRYDKAVEGFDQEEKKAVLTLLDTEEEIVGNHPVEEAARQIRGILQETREYLIEHGHHVGYLEGYLPHIFQGRFWVKAENEYSQKVEALGDALKIAQAWAEEGKTGIRVMQDTFIPPDDATMLTRRSYWRLVKAIQKEVGESVDLFEELSKEEVHRMLSEGKVARAKPKKRFFGNMRQRIVNNPNFLKDLDQVMHLYFYGASRKVSQDEFLTKVETQVEKMPANDQRLRQFIEAEYLPTVLAHPTNLEEAIANVLHKYKIMPGATGQGVRQMFHKVNLVQYVMDLGLSASSAIANGTQFWINAYPIIGEKSALKGYGKGAKTFRSAQLLEEVEQAGITQSVSSITGEVLLSRGAVKELKEKILKGKGGVQGYLEATLIPFTSVELVNRFATYWGGKDFALKHLDKGKSAVEIARQVTPETSSLFGLAKEWDERMADTATQRTGRWHRKTREMKERFARRFGYELNEKVNFRAGRENLPSLLREVPLRLLSPYKSFLTNQIKYTLQALSPKGIRTNPKKALRFTAMVLGLAGVAGNPVIYGLFLLVNELFKKLFGVNLEKELRRRNLERGLTGKLGFDISGSVAVQMPTRLYDWMGRFGKIAWEVGQLAKQKAQGAGSVLTERKLERLSMPAQMQRIADALNILDQGYYETPITRSMVTLKEEPWKAAVKRAMGMMPANVAKTFEEEEEIKKKKEKYKSLSQDLTERWATAIKEGNLAQADKVIRRVVREINDSIEKVSRARTKDEMTEGMTDLLFWKAYLDQNEKFKNALLRKYVPREIETRRRLPKYLRPEAVNE